MIKHLFDLENLAPEMVRFLFLKKTTRYFFSSCFGFDSATIDAQMLFWLVFLKTQKKVIDRQKRHFGCFWRLVTVFLCIFKNIDKNNICVSIVLKGKTEKKLDFFFLTLQKKTFLNFEIKTVKKILFIFFFCFSFKYNRLKNVI